MGVVFLENDYIIIWDHHIEQISEKIMDNFREEKLFAIRYISSCVTEAEYLNENQ